MPRASHRLGWHALVYVYWGVRILRGVDATPEVRRRAEAAAQWLTDLARASPSIAAVTHGVIRGLVATQLLALGRRQTAGRRYRPWSVWTFRAAPTQRGI